MGCFLVKGFVIMKRIVLVCALLLTSAHIYSLDQGPIPFDTVANSFMFPHPAIFDVAREQAMWHNFMYNKKGDMRAAMQLIPFFQKSTVSDDPINKQAGYFLPTCKSIILIAGDDAGMDLTRDVRAEWINLPSNFSGVMKVSPQQEQYGVVVELNQDVAKFTDNTFLDYFWFSFTLPVLTVKNNMNIRQGELSNTGTSFSSPHDIVQAFNQCEWQFAKINGEMKKTGYGEFKCKLGGVLYAKDGFEIDFYELISIPTSGKSNSEFIFSPFLGNNGHWAIGSGVNFQFPVTRFDAHTPLLVFMNIEHQFLLHQDHFRTFDLKGKPWSRYMLYNSADGSQVNVPGVNILTQYVHVKPDSFVDFEMGFRIQFHCFEAEVAYDLWAHGNERIEYKHEVCPDCEQQVDFTKFGIAGSSAGTSASNSFINTQAPNDPSFVALRPSDLDRGSAASHAAICNRIHGSLGWAYVGSTFAGFVNFGGYGEFSQSNAALNLWGLWGKVGASF